MDSEAEGDDRDVRAEEMSSSAGGVGVSLSQKEPVSAKSQSSPTSEERSTRSATSSRRGSVSSTPFTNDDHYCVGEVLAYLRKSKGADWEEQHLDFFLMRFSHVYQFKGIKRFRSIFTLLVQERILNRLGSGWAPSDITHSLS